MFNESTRNKWLGKRVMATAYRKGVLQRGLWPGIVMEMRDKMRIKFDDPELDEAKIFSPSEKEQRGELKLLED